MNSVSGNISELTLGLDTLRRLHEAYSDVARAMGRVPVSSWVVKEEVFTVSIGKINEREANIRSD